MVSEGTERKTTRLEAFSDAVLAIGITLPVVDLHAPELAHRADLGVAYGELIPGYLTYVASVVVIGLFWAHSHFNGKILEKTDHVFNLMSVVFLALVTLTPFPARAFFEHYGSDANGRTAAAVYAWLLAAPLVVWIIRWIYARWQGLLDPLLAKAYLNRLTRKYCLTAVIATAGAVIATWVDAEVGLIITALVIASYFAPPSKPEYRPGLEHANLLEDAGDRSD